MPHSYYEIDEWVLVEQNNLADRVSNSIHQLGFKKLPFEFRYGIKEKCLRLSEKAIKLLLPFPSTYLSEARFSFYTSTKKQKIEGRSQLLLSQTLRILQKHKTMPLFSLNFFP